MDYERIIQVSLPAQQWAVGSGMPGPGIPEPDCGQEMQIRGFFSPIVDGDPDQDVFMRGFGIFDEDIEITLILKDTGVPQFKFRIVFAPSLVFLDESGIRKGGLRVLVEVFHVRMRGRRVQIKIIFFDIFAVVALVAGEAEQSFLQDRVTAIPQRQGKTDELVAVANAAQAVFSPAIGA